MSTQGHRSWRVTQALLTTTLDVDPSLCHRSTHSGAVIPLVITTAARALQQYAIATGQARLQLVGGGTWTGIDLTFDTQPGGADAPARLWRNLMLLLLLLLFMLLLFMLLLLL